MNKHRASLFSDMQQLAVSLVLLRFRDAGGPTELDWEWLRTEAPAVIETTSEAVVVGGKGCAAGFNAIARAVAISAYLPGGITWCEQHYEETVPAPSEQGEFDL